MRALLFLCLAFPAAAAPLEQVVIVTRHGVRAPSKPGAAYAAYSTVPWPAWPVAPGDLTPHGAQATQRMGEWLRAHYAAAGVLPSAGCPGKADLFVYADGADHRTVQSGEAIYAGLAPSCAAGSTHGPAGQPDPVFAAVEAGACPLDAATQQMAVARAEAALAALPPTIGPAFAALNTVLAPPHPIGDGQNVVAARWDGTKIFGPLATGASLAENLSLEYLQGMTRDRLDGPTLATIMALHTVSTGIGRRNPVTAGHNGAVLAARILAALADPKAPKMTVFVGHDSNLDNLAGIFGLEWQLADQADPTAPDGELVFERYRGAGGDPVIRVTFRYQTGLQLREARALTGSEKPGEVMLHPSYCAADGCTLAALRAQAVKVIPASCAPHG